MHINNNSRYDNVYCRVVGNAPGEGVPFPWLAGMSVVLIEGNYRSQYQLSTQKSLPNYPSTAKGKA